MVFEKMIELFIYPIQLFERFLTSTSTLNIFLGMFGIYVTYRFILKPLLGGRAFAGSDSAKSKKNSSKGSDSVE